MRLASPLARLTALLTLGALASVASVASAQTAPAPGACTLGTAQNDLAVNNVAARVFNTGSLFYGNTTVDGTGYLVPRASGRSPLFAASLWVSGNVNGDVRAAGGVYGGPGFDLTFWPGPLGDDARPIDPSDCSPYDRIYSVSRADVAAYESGGPASADLADWPAALGAPVIDGDGVAGNYNLAGGDRPDIVGDQGVWWLMNDVGNIHPAQGTPPLGIEARVLAYAFTRADALGDATFYRYTITNRTDDDITDAYVSFFVDPDLGDATDDFVGTDTTLGMGYAYNGDDEDEVYGVPPAIGYDIVRGPVVPDGPDAGTDPDTLAVTASSYFINGPNLGFSVDGPEMHNLQQGLFADGTPMRAFGDGYAETQGEVTTFAFPGDPVTGQLWSEVNVGGGDNTPTDRRFALHTGPFTLAAGASQEVTLAIVFAQGTDNLNSITALRAASRLAQAAFDGGLTTSAPAPPPSIRDERVTLSPPAPNPFTGRSTVTVRTPTGTPLRAVLYDVLGRRIAVLHDGPTATDAVEIAVDGSGLAPGVYRLHVVVPGGEETVQMLRR